MTWFNHKVGVMLKGKSGFLAAVVILASMSGRYEERVEIGDCPSRFFVSFFMAITKGERKPSTWKSR